MPYKALFKKHKFLFLYQTLPRNNIVLTIDQYSLLRALKLAALTLALQFLPKQCNAYFMIIFKVCNSIAYANFRAPNKPRYRRMTIVELEREPFSIKCHVVF